MGSKVVEPESVNRELMIMHLLFHLPAHVVKE
jgi:hypothetical protein